MTFPEKPKRKRKNGRLPYLFLGAGVLIGLFVAALLLGGFVLFVGVDSQSQEVVFVPSPVMTNSEFSAQEAQPMPTVIATRVRGVAVSPDGSRLAVASVTGGVTEIRIESQYLSDSLLPQHSSESTVHSVAGLGYSPELAFDRNSRFLAVYGIDGRQVIIFNLDTGETHQFDGMTVAAFSPQRDLLALAGNQRGLRILDTTNPDMELVGSILMDDNPRDVAFSPDGERIALASYSPDGAKLVIYNLDNLAQPYQTYSTRSSWAKIAFHPAGDYIAITEGNTVRMIEFANASYQEFYLPQLGTVRDVAFSPDGEWLVAGGGQVESGATVTLVSVRWEGRNPIPPQPTYYDEISLNGHTHNVQDLAFTRAGYLVSAADDGSLRMWNLDTQAMISTYQP